MSIEFFDQFRRLADAVLDRLPNCNFKSLSSCICWLTMHPGKLKKIMKSLSASDETKKYQGFKFLSKKSLNATKVKSGSIKLKNGKKFSLKVVKVHRAQRQNTITVDVLLGSDEQQKSFIDQKYLILNAGELDKKSDLVIAVHCPVFP